MTLKKSHVTGRWLTMTSINGSERRCISCCHKHADAVQASQQIAEAFGKIAPEDWDRPETFSEAVSALPFDDDDEVLAVGRLMPNDQFLIDTRQDTLNSSNQMLNEASSGKRPNTQ